jgi:hypothetical protein
VSTSKASAPISAPTEVSDRSTSAKPNSLTSRS